MRVSGAVRSHGLWGSVLCGTTQPYTNSWEVERISVIVLWRVRSSRIAFILLRFYSAGRRIASMEYVEELRYRRGSNIIAISFWITVHVCSRLLAALPYSRSSPYTKHVCSHGHSLQLAVCSCAGKWSVSDGFVRARQRMGPAGKRMPIVSVWLSTDHPIVDCAVSTVQSMMITVLTFLHVWRYMFGWVSSLSSFSSSFFFSFFFLSSHHIRFLWELGTSRPRREGKFACASCEEKWKITTTTTCIMDIEVWVHCVSIEGLHHRLPWGRRLPRTSVVEQNRSHAKKKPRFT